MKKIKLIGIITVICFLISLSCGGTVFALSSSEFYRWLDNSGIPEYSISGSYRANYGTFIKYNLVVYGNPGDVSLNEIRQGEYRYLGFTYMEGRYTNLDFPNDETGNLLPEQWDYVAVSGAAESWDTLEQSVQLPYMLYTALDGHGATTLTASDIGTSKAKVQSAASWSSSGSIYTYKSNNFYATFTVPSMGLGILSAEMSPDSSTVYIDISDQGVDTGVNFSAAVNKPKNEVDFIKVVFSCGTWRKVRYFHNTNNISFHLDAFLDLPTIVPGSHCITAVVTSESIFGDKLQNEVTCNISIKKSTILATPSPTLPPIPLITPRPNPTPATIPPTSIPIPTQPPAPSPTSGSGTNPPAGNNALEIFDLNVYGSWSHWDSQTHRFLALEKVLIEAKLKGRIESAVIRLSPELESMVYINSLGYTYNYENDFFGYTVEFPTDSHMEFKSALRGVKTYVWEYSLPLCNETVDWNGNRKSEPYFLQLEIIGKNGKSEVLILDDIDITGNIYELLYPQPAD